MSYQYEIKKAEGFIRVEVSGIRKPNYAGNDALGVWTDISAYAASVGINKVLYLSSVSGQIPVMEAYDVLDQFVEKQWIGLQVAYVDLGGSNIDDLRMLKAICFQHGMLFDYFKSEDEGIRWLQALE
ncbi:hypothetical protein ACMXYN_01200 [Neptuniibacter sp. PT8_73]|uniref:hypothetical protein n=1 Tax=unclassified Neptuniibacter TaxID=2630693 RepID=UPI0039F669CC